MRKGRPAVYIYVLEGGYDTKRINQYGVRKGGKVRLSCLGSSLSSCLLLKAESITQSVFLPSERWCLGLNRGSQGHLDVKISYASLQTNVVGGWWYSSLRYLLNSS